MKKRLICYSVVFMAVLIIALSAFTVYAEMIYEYYGYKYVILTNSTVSLSGWDNSSPSVKIPESINGRQVVEIRNRAFMENDTVNSVDFSSAVYMRRIGMFAFKDCINLSGVLSFPESVNTMDTGAFEGCTSVNGVRFDPAMIDIPAQCFYKCSSLSSVVLSERTERIGNYAFADCISLTYIELPASVNEIGQTAFRNDSELTLGVYFDSYAHHYAEQNGFNFIILDPENVPTEPSTEPETQEPTLAPNVYMLGDADNSGYIDIVDATFVQRSATGVDIPGEILEGFETRANVDGNSEVDIVDATFIMRHIVRMKTPYAIGEVFTVA